MATKISDITLVHHGSVYVLYFRSREAQAWLRAARAHQAFEAWQFWAGDGLAVDRHGLTDLVGILYGDGLRVA
jgi:hypothetical protein